MGGSDVRVRWCQGKGRQREKGVCLCGNGAHPWEAPGGLEWEHGLVESSRRLPRGDFLLSQLLSVCQEPCVSVVHRPPPTVFLCPSSFSPSSTLLSFVPFHPLLFLPFTSPYLPLLLPSHQFLLLSLLPSFSHPPSSNYASFCLSNPSSLPSLLPPPQRRRL